MSAISQSLKDISAHRPDERISRLNVRSQARFSVFLLAFCVLVFFLSACSSIKTDSAQPNWVLNPPADTREDFWGVGEGPDIDSATRQALRQIAARLRVSVSAVTESSVAVAQQTVVRSDQTRIREVVRETEFTGVSVRQSAQHAAGVHALVRVDRRIFARETAARFDELYRQVNSRLQTSSAQDALSEYRTLQAALPDIEQAVLLGQLLRVVDDATFSPVTFNRLLQIRQTLPEKASRVTVRLEHPPVDYDAAAVVSQWLAKAGFQQVSAGSPAILSVRVDGRTEAIFDSWNSRLSVSLVWRDDRGNIVANRTHDIKGTSLESPQRARQNAMTRWAQTSVEVDVPTRLGLVQ